MEPNVFDKVHDIDLKKTMEKSYIDYAMSVIAARALPDVRDGLKPVQRRVLYSMIELNNGPDMHRERNFILPGKCINDAVHFFQVVSTFRIAIQKILLFIKSYI